ncbi:hypothetical protein [uncultured Halomonas sp.]|uniref:hypothetical protein n=1 Tax=uncultured Halomonas sp. TaxID=173971 RepID=UPI002607BD35|nr:hypothetical protein [uncultured Halomonas sp.]
MNPHATILSPRDHTSPLSVVGVDVTVLISKNETNGREITLQRGDEGVGPPPHSHPWDESFYVLPGSPDLPTLLEVLNQHSVTIHGGEEA